MNGSEHPGHGEHEGSKQPQRSPPARQSYPPEASPRATRAVETVVQPVERLLKTQASSGILLLGAAVIAMIWANSPWSASYHHLWEIPIRLGAGDLTFERSLHFWINDGLMVLFFLVAGMEIRHEIHEGQLSSLRSAALPLLGAVGGMVVPAGIYVALNFGQAGMEGWGVPMATDIAFAVGIIALLGSRIPSSLRILLLAIAVVDDIGAILVIAFFYTQAVSWLGLAVAGAGLLLVLVLQRTGARHVLSYVLPGLVVWGGFVASGVHPTVAGVTLGLLTPPRVWLSQEQVQRRAKSALEEVREAGEGQELMGPLKRLKHARREAVSPLTRVLETLNPWVYWAVIPVFALANAGVTLGTIDLGAPGSTMILLGVALGLFVGKPLGVFLAALVAVKSNVGTMPEGLNKKAILVIGMVAGIGFTMALFIAQLAFTDPARLGVAKLGVLIGSLASGVVGLSLGALAFRRKGGPAGEAASAS